MDLYEVINHFELTELTADSDLYVDVNEARTGPNRPSVRSVLEKEMELCYLNNQKEGDAYVYRKLLLSGHRGCGKTTELHRAAKELDEKYVVIFIENIERHQSRITSQADFLYYIVESVVDFCNKNDDIKKATYQQINILKEHLQIKIFGEESTTEDRTTTVGGDMEAEIGASFDFVLKLLGRLGFKESYAESKKNTVNVNIKNYMQNFIEIANNILLKIQQVCRAKDKMPLLILDGLDKVPETLSEEIFLGTHSFLADLKCSMIITFPLYLNYSSRYQEAISPFGSNDRSLSTIPVNHIDGTPDEHGRAALKSIVEKRMDIESIVEDPKNIDDAIAKSGGNLRDLFTYIRNAAMNAYAMDHHIISPSDFDVAYQDKENIIKKQLKGSYKTVLVRVFEGSGKKSILRVSDDSGTLLAMFAAGLLIEYNGERWVDLHPLLREIMNEQGENLWPKSYDG